MKLMFENNGTYNNYSFASFDIFTAVYLNFVFFWEMMGCHWVTESECQLTQLHIPEEQNLQFFISNVNF